MAWQKKGRTLWKNRKFWRRAGGRTGRVTNCLLYTSFLGRAGLYLEDLYVRPEHRGKGYGKAFFRRLAAIAAERDCGRLEWWCLDWNTPSIGFYKSLGAETMEDWTVYRLTGPALQRLAEPESPVAETDEI